MNVKQMTSKRLHIAIKNECTVDDLLAQYKIQTDENLFEIIRRVSPGNAETFIKKLKANQKKAERRGNMKETSDSENPENKLKVEIVAPEFEEEVAVEEEEPEKKTADIFEETQKSLEQLKADEEIYSRWCRELEGQHKEMARRRREIVEALVKVKETLQELQRLLRLNREKTLELSAEYNGLADAMTEKFREIASYQEVLEEIREQIAELQQIYIWVFSDHIEVERGERLEFSDEESMVLFKRLVQNPEAEKLTIREVKTVAKLLMMVESYQEAGKKVELVFDSEQVQQFYETVNRTT